MHVAAIESVRGERRHLEKSSTRINQQVDALARQHFAARGVTFARGLAATAGDLIELFAQLGDECTHGLGVAAEIG